MAASATPSKGPKGDKMMRDALMVALKRPSTQDPDRKNFAIIAERVVDMALGDDREMIKLIFERVDGKAIQPVEGSGTDGEFVFRWLGG
jgi:hypothetical protein